MTRKATTEEAPLSKPLTSRSSGFTLIEILVVVAIIAILSAITFPIYQNYIDKAKRTVAVNTLETLRKAMEGYHITHGTYPLLIDPLTGLDEQGRPVLEADLLYDFKKNIFSLESYTPTADDYVLTAKAMDSIHTLLIMSPAKIVNQGQL
jgi:prepilin-type N-terminal cleavage/methylation domain-containing protein